MQTILSEKQIELLQLNHIDFQQFVETNDTLHPKIKRQLKRYSLHPKVAWDADSSILLLAWLSLQQSQHKELADEITYVLNYQNNINIGNWLDVERRAKYDIQYFYRKLTELENFRFLAWFFCHADSILKIYKYDTKNVIDLTFHTFEVNTPNFKLKGSQEFALNWLLERIQIIIKYNYRHEDIKKFFLVWAEVHSMFWW